MAGLHFELVTPAQLLRTGDVHMVVVPGSEGDFGVLAGHAPMLSTIRPGEIAIYATPATEKPERLTVKGGLAEVNAQGLTILAEHVAEVAAH